LADQNFCSYSKKKLGKDFDTNTIITQKDFDNFWNWFGPVLQKIRYCKFLLPMWNQGLVWGIIDKHEAEKQLKNFGVGTFLLRFSERQPGALAIAYKQSKSQCRHYLVKNTDITGQGRSLPNFIRESFSLLQFLRVSDFGSERSVSVIDKHQGLLKIGNKRKKVESDVCNYDDELIDLERLSI